MLYQVSVYEMMHIMSDLTGKQHCGTFFLVCLLQGSPCKTNPLQLPLRLGNLLYTLGATNCKVFTPVFTSCILFNWTFIQQYIVNHTKIVM